ncbi:S9 family peptidase [Dokdonella sp.]|uniref:S9 family peptidase n=1 Tax=Dokdonella sp. TaxID=2291710 RepID=UPI001B24974A|nr:S9 family peptidase [Dokdonella sp.]MBO9661908.1 prolyl oligopeptidase family serine peptidase [Dokdonella sp.]
MPRARRRFAFTTLALAGALAGAAANAADVPRIESGNRISENVPEIPAALGEQLQRYANTRSAGLGGWIADGSGLLITTRFGNTAQVHRVKTPGGAREQLTFYDEPIAAAMPNPKRNGFVFGKDVGGSEFWQLYWFDLATRETRLLTDGKSRNDGPLWSHDGARLAYSSTARNGKDTDVWVLDLDGGAAKPVLTEGGSWNASDFSPDGKKLLVQQYVSINDVRPGVVDLDSGKLTRFPVDGGKASFGAFRFAPDGSGAYFTSDEGSEFSTLRFHDFKTGKVVPLSAGIAWDVEDYALSPDGRRVAFVSNEDGFGVLHLLDAATRKELPLPTLPKGVIGGVEFSPDGKRIAFSLNSAVSPSDVYTVDPEANTVSRRAKTEDGSVRHAPPYPEPAVERWTESEVGGLDASTFASPELVRFPTFDKAGGKVRTIPAFYYRPKAAAGKKLPVVIQIHGGPEAQARPVFSAEIQFLVDQLGVAVLVPNVRGSSGYGKSYLQLDNGFKREDSVKDIGALLDWIGKQPELDAQRVAVYGGSYGGYMVLATMTRYDARLRAGVDIVGISNFVTFLNNTESYRRDLRRAEYGDERDAKMKDFLEKISPTTNAKAITKPLFVAQGANDPRVPASEAAQIVKTVRGNGGDVWFLEFKDEGHGFRKKSNVDYFRAATMLFWQKYLIGG